VGNKRIMSNEIFTCLMSTLTHLTLWTVFCICWRRQFSRCVLTTCS